MSSATVSQVVEGEYRSAFGPCAPQPVDVEVALGVNVKPLLLRFVSLLVGSLVDFVGPGNRHEDSYTQGKQRHSLLLEVIRVPHVGGRRWAVTTFALMDDSEATQVLHEVLVFLTLGTALQKVVRLARVHE